VLELRWSLAPKVLVGRLVDGRGYVEGVGHLEERQQHRHQQLPLAVVSHQVADHVGLVLIVRRIQSAHRRCWRLRRRCLLFGRDGGAGGGGLFGGVVHDAQRN